MKSILILAIIFMIAVNASGQMGSSKVPNSLSFDTVNALAPVTTGQGMIVFPNAFLWNRSGPTGGYTSENPDDYLFAPAAKNVASYKLEVFSRKGALVFQSTDVRIGWDGYLENGAVAQQGVYVWKASGSFNDGSKFKKNGNVTFIY